MTAVPRAVIWDVAAHASAPRTSQTEAERILERLDQIIALLAAIEAGTHSAASRSSG